MQQVLSFTPGSGDDPMSLAFPDFANIHGIYLPAPTTAVSFQIPNGSGGWTTIYQISTISGFLSAETIPFDMPGLTQMQIVGNGSGALMYVFVTTAFVSPFKEATVFSVPSTLDLSALNIFNALAYGVSTAATGVENVTALNEAVAAAQAVGGGEIWIPNIAGGQLPIAGTIEIPNNANNSVNVHSTSNAQIMQQSLAQDTFFTNNDGNPGNRAGVTFDTIHVFYDNPITSGAGFNVQARNAYLNNIVVEDAPVGVWLQDCLSAVLSKSDILYHNNLESIGIIIGGAAGRAHQTRVERTQVEFNNNGGPSSIGMQILCGRSLHLRR